MDPASSIPDLLARHAAEPTGLDHTLGIRYEKLDADEVVGVLEVGPAHHQPLGYLHGGVSVALAESVASVGATLNAPEGMVAFGMEINANHLRPVQSGRLTATGRPLHRGRSTQVWEIRLADDEKRLVCVARCTLAVVEARSGGDGRPG